MTVLDEVRRLVDRAVDALGDDDGALLALRRRLDEPLRVAIAGKVKAGKSTLLNALIGEELAPTDAGECTRIVTWYRDSHTAQVVVEPLDGGAPRQVPFTRSDGGALGVDVVASEVARLVVDWPSERLRRMTLVDTPGMASLSEDVAARTEAFLTPADGAPVGADAVLYLMKHLHAEDVRFLETFSSSGRTATPVNAIAVLARADEVGAGRPDAMESAARIAARYAADERVQRLCQAVVPVAGLVAVAGATLRESELAELRSLASLDAPEVESRLASADRFSAGSAERAALLRRLGVFGVRLATSLLRSGSVSTGPELARALSAASGLDALRATVTELFGDRADVLKARSALLELEPIVAASGSAELAAELERITASAHELVEVSVVTALRSGAVTLPGTERERALRLLGAGGARARLGLSASAGDDEVRAAATAELAHWRGRAENPVLGQEAVEVCRALARTCEGLVARG